MSLADYFSWLRTKEIKMKELIKRIFLEAVKDYLKQTFTLENVLKFRDEVIAKLRAQVEDTETKLDDYTLEVLETILNDCNIARIYNWLISRHLFIEENTCGASPEQYGKLADEIEFNNNLDGRTCAVPAIITVVQFLEIIVPVLIEWFKSTKK